jgi:asparagine synthase (glutamine-hydrolysing)
MCGILGGCGSRCQKQDILTGLDLLQHRGKDERFFAQCASHVFLGMNRPSIQDSQPGLYPFKYKQYSLLLNGELYNLAELTKHLLKKGVTCKTKCDAEVILPLFDLYGSDAFKMLDGMFAIAIYDEQKKTISLARDLFGEKPLYYTIIDDSCFFASEIQALPAFTHRVNELVIPEFLTFGFLNANRTFYQDVMKVLPGEFVQINKGKLVRKQFDTLSNHLDTQTTSSHLAADLDKRLQKIAHKKIT